MTSFVQQGNQIQQTQDCALKLQQEGDHVPKFPFMLNTPQSQDQPLHQLLHLQHQQQFQSQLSSKPTTNNGMHQIMQPGLSNSGSMNIQKGKQAGSSKGLGKRKRGGKN